MGLFGLVMAGRRSLPRVLPLFRNPRVPVALKAVTIALALAIVSPLDPLSDIPILGLLDDAALLALLSSAFVALAARWLATRPAPARVSNVTPATYRR